MASSIGESSRNLRTNFGRLIAALQRSEKENRSPLRIILPLGAIEDESARYCLWAGSLGAFHGPSDTRSLEYRVHQAPAIRQKIQDLLVELGGVLENGMYLNYQLFSPLRASSELEARFRPRLTAVQLSWPARVQRALPHLTNPRRSLHHQPTKPSSWNSPSLRAPKSVARPGSSRLSQIQYPGCSSCPR
jgi:hypothetical protein